MNPGNSPFITTKIAAPPSANFDRVALPYRWMEYLTFGPLLRRCRNYFLPQLVSRRSALVLGDGDGRFIGALLAANFQIHIDAVDFSGTMLRMLVRRARAITPDSSSRLRAHHSDALTFARALPASAQYDLIVTHFFLDCLTQSDVESLAQIVAAHLNHPGALWLISDFRIPESSIHWPARLLVRCLYLAFRILTGLRITHLPNHASALRAAGFHPTKQHLSIAGILTTELWAWSPSSRPA